MKKVVIIDYKLGNLFSVKQACLRVGLEPTISSDKADIENANALILPGVGAFAEAMKNLNDLNLSEVIIEKVEKGTPIMGICLGLQILFEKSEEFENCNGLGLINGKVKKFKSNQNIKVPQMGWNNINAANTMWENTFLNGISPSEFMYFVHSFYVEPTDKKDVLCTTNYGGIDYCSGVWKNNIFAVQFHPEKSGKEGLKIYNNWANYIKTLE